MKTTCASEAIVKLQPTVKTEKYELWLGDALEILPLLSGVDAVVTDPPYPELKGGHTFVNGGVAGQKELSASVGDLWDASWEWLDLVAGTGAGALISFTGFAGLPSLLCALPGKVVLVGAWHKPNAHPGNPRTPRYTLEHYVGAQVKTGFNWNGVPDLIISTQDFGGCISRGERIRDEMGANVHPCQKPLGVMMPLCPKHAKVICDPFMGTATTGAACIEKGIYFIGIERDPAHFQTSVERLETATGKFSPREFGGLFANPTP